MLASPIVAALLPEAPVAGEQFGETSAYDRVPIAFELLGNEWRTDVGNGDDKDKLAEKLHLLANCRKLLVMRLFL